MDPGGSDCGGPCLDAGAPPDGGRFAPPPRPAIGAGLVRGEPQIDCATNDSSYPCATDDPDAGDAGALGDASADAAMDAEVACDPEQLCATGELRASAPRVLLLVDRSGSMTYPFAAGLSRWEALTRVLAEPQSGVIAQFAGVEFGLAFYTYRGAATASCEVLSQIFLGDFMAAFEEHPPILDGQTPTAEALQQAAKLLSAPFDSSTPSGGSGPLSASSKQAASAIVLATDGMPDSCLDQKVDTEGSAAAQRAVAASVVAQVEALYRSGIPTYVVGVGSQLQQAHLQDLANAGIGYAASSGVGQPGTVYQAGDSVALRAAFDDHVSTLESCGFDLDHEVSDVSLAEVTLAGRALQWGTDWKLQTPSRVVLIGAACDELKRSGGVVTAVVPCGCR